MKKNILFVLVPVLLIASACGNGPTSSPTTSVEEPTTHVTSTIPTTTKEANLYYTIDGELQARPINIVYKENSSTPYINAEDVTFALNVGFTKVQPSDILEDNVYTVSDEKGVATITHEILDTTCVIDGNQNQIIIEDLSIFASHTVDNPFGFAPSNASSCQYVTGNPEITGVDIDYTPGEEIIVDFNEFEHTSVFSQNGHVYMPVSVVTSLLLATSAYASLTYNLKDVYLLEYADASEIHTGTSEILTKYRSETKTLYQFDESYTIYNYESLLMLFTFNWANYDRFGKIEDFDKYFEEIGVKDDLLSGISHKIDEALFKVTHGHLLDLHTSFMNHSVFTDQASLNYDTSSISPILPTFQGHINSYKNARIESLGGLVGYTIVGNTLFYLFNGFDDAAGVEINPPYDAQTALNGAVIEQFYYLREIVQNDETIKNVVLDLSLNTGGSSDTFAFAVNTMIGDFVAKIHDPVTGAVVRHTVTADINADGKFDDQDVSLQEMGYNIGVIISPVSFSFGNYMPYVLKYQGDNVVTFGDRTGGGTCAVYNVVTPTGTVFNLSGRMAFSEVIDGEISSVENGLVPDYQLSVEETYNYSYIDSVLNETFGLA